MSTNAFAAIVLISSAVMTALSVVRMIRSRRFSGEGDLEYDG